TYHVDHMSFFSHHTATTDIYTLSLHDALPILVVGSPGRADGRARARVSRNALGRRGFSADHSRRGGGRPRARRPARPAAEPAAYDRSARISAGHLRVGNAGGSVGEVS